MKTNLKTLTNNVLLKVFLAILTIFLGSESAFSQSTVGTISGKAILKDGNSLQGAKVKISELNKTTITDSEGFYQLKNIPFGTYLVEIDLNGYDSMPATISIDQNNLDAKIDFELTYTSQKLEEVIISSGGNRFARKESEEVSKMKLKNMENPQVYTIVSKELMKEQVITDYNSAFKNVPGAGIAEVRNQGRTTSISRGFATPQLVRNGVGSFTYNSIDPSNLERIEVIKGPSATLFGSTISSFGGLFNRVTKKPFDFFKGEVSYSAGDWDLNRFTADINTPLNDDKTALFRINTALHSERSFQDAGFSKSFFIAPSFSYQVNDRLTLLIDAEFSASKGTSPTRLAPFTGATATAHSITEMGIPYKLSFANNTINYTGQQYNIFAQLKYKISEEWTSQTVVSRTRSSSEGYTVALTALSNETLRQQVTSQDYPYYGTDIQQNFNGDFKIGKLRNRVVAGLDFYSLRATRNDATINMPAINYKKPGDAYNNFTEDRIAPLFATAKFNNFVSNNERTYSAYVSDVLNVTDRLLVMGGIRADRYINKGVYYPSRDSIAGSYNQTAFSPRFGAVYQVIKEKVSVFGNYMNGFNNVGGSDFNGNTFKPNQANQLEGGVKFDFNKISATFSYYDIKVTNITRDDPDHANFQIQDGTQLSKGFEAELIANPIRGLNIVAGYTYNDSEYTKANPSVNGLRPTTAGSPRTANLWASYRLFEGPAAGLGFGFGGIYGSEYYQTNTATFKFSIPSYTVLDASVFYDRPKFRLGLKIDNLTNEKYWSYRLAAQNPTRVTGNITFKF
ncbi:iron complex outermembrane receptor protein [Flavobacterium nitrogenifigens]|uniref:Iron complex outermembrane receptor protein n=2 Tax=Flavobacterium TaxID=237 RepID=A0A7W7N936_9FLAO|nr:MULTISPECIES: TonB-dependent siderophore receptor [Flavobacterium]MBB4804620.1 iron complex outermembrane receptor protein [Flavobacterium nitrogenifigens]MBB6389579.1 iron complex outermembrane receptor protein [Flavobacterium notoginsengisoli]